ncbi:MAG: isocitrate/isopropylmalate dehydrogenase family protein [Dehalococcoidia bacterium]|nr:isocitrate/isopropylmalate dehydrogenase family protein [Dehalococcoidia bacterium]
MAYTITLIPGDGIGPEVTNATVRVLEATGIKFNWEPAMAGQEAYDKCGTPLPNELLDSITKNKVALKGPITTPIGTGFRSANVALRKGLDLYVCLRPCKSYPGAPSIYTNVDVIIVRENTEDLYLGIECRRQTEEAAKLIRIIEEIGHRVHPDSSFSIKAISPDASRRIAQYSFDYARAFGRKKVTVVHKANILKETDGLFLSVTEEVAGDYPDIEFESHMVDSMCSQLVRFPQHHDVIVLPNLYGDIVSELCAGLIGGLGLAPGANIGNDISVFEPTHGSAPKYAGQNKVNPMAMMLSGVLMLRHLGEMEAADRVENAIAQVIAEGKYVTYDMKFDRNDPTAVGTSQVADAVIEKMKELSYA